MWILDCPTEDDIASVADALHQALPKRAVVVLSGTLGAGKTRLVQAFAKSTGVDETVTSPTFVLCQHYEGERLIHHLDAYRMKSSSEFEALGGLELIQDDAITFIEWGERIDEVLPEDRVEIQIEIMGDTARRFVVTVVGDVELDAKNFSVG